MIGKTPDQKQASIFKTALKQVINPRHELVRLADLVPWREFEKNFKKLYSHTGVPAKPIRLMAGLLILKQLCKLSDENVVKEWEQNPYFQFFCGQSEFQWERPCDPSDLARFRHRLGKEGVDKIMEISEKTQGNKKKKVKAKIQKTGS